MKQGVNHVDPHPHLNLRIDAGVGVLRTRRTTVAVQELCWEKRSGMGTLPAAVWLVEVTTPQASRTKSRLRCRDPYSEGYPVSVPSAFHLALWGAKNCCRSRDHDTHIIVVWWDCNRVLTQFPSLFSSVGAEWKCQSDHREYGTPIRWKWIVMIMWWWDELLW